MQIGFYLLAVLIVSNVIIEVLLYKLILGNNKIR